MHDPESDNPELMDDVAADQPFCDEHGIAYEECPECLTEGTWRHPDHGLQPCVTCFGAGVVPHTCPSREGDEGAGP